MPMPEEFDKTVQEIASSEEDKEKIAETGYFYLAQQINFNTQQISRLDNKIDKLDEKMETKFSLLENRINGLENRINGLDNRINSLMLWMIATVITMIVGFGGIITVLALKI
jgi:flagellar capping protein FliD